MRKTLRDHSLSLAMFALFVLFLVRHSVAGYYDYNDDQHAHQQSLLSYPAYLTSGHFWATVFENWESEFLQMGIYVLFTAFLRQKGSPESKKLVGEEDVDRDPRREMPPPDAPWPVRRGGIALTLYAHSLTAVLLLLFVACLLVHAVSGARAYNAEQVAHGEAPLSVAGYLLSATFWFESLQNWQSEFLSLAVMIVLAIFLRQRGSPESKPVDHPHYETGRGAS